MTERVEPKDITRLIQKMQEDLDARQQAEHAEWLQSHPEQVYASSSAFPEMALHLKTVVEELDDLKARIAAIEAVPHAAKGKKNPEQKWYLGTFLAAALVVVLLCVKGWAATPTVAITFNVGEIVGGLLAGVGALAAGVAYAVRRMGGQ